MYSQLLGTKISFLFGAHSEDPAVVLDSARRIAAGAKERGLDYEIVAVDDSGCGRFAKVDAPNTFVLVNDRNHGKGYSLARATMFATGTLFLYTDCDLPVNVFAALDSVGSCNAVLANTLFLGDRTLAESVVLRAVPPSMPRIVTSWLFRTYVRYRIGTNLGDTQCPLKVIGRRNARALFRDLEIPGYAFDVELVTRARAMGIDLVSVPVHYHDGRARMSWLKAARHTLRMARDVQTLPYSLSSSTPRFGTSRSAGLSKAPKI
ncbi:hypothetical protein [Rhizobium rhizogenes]|uniref:hypothetical protein n=1 Tax=Rhizobium rhizogenes TaxID=359 RepID=UPI001571E24C|nr:hypothetical protein [Rhizobium rhizogenes]NTF65761.1 hypothetical protein [Rhizobium rhizogenes]NTG97113.1 hypothetical protein [Rhizobium rhizogenes]